MPWIVPDFETASACDLKACGSWRYSEDPSTDVLCLDWQCQDGTEGTWAPGEPDPEDLFKRIREGHHFVAHSCAFEKGIWRNIMVKLYGWPDVADTQFWDTQAVCAMRVIPLGLDRVLKVLGLPEEKDMEGNKLTLSLSRVNKKTGMFPVRTPEIITRVREYCRGDIRGQVVLHNRLGWLPEGEARVFQLNQKINQRGVRLDLALAGQMQKIVDDTKRPLLVEFEKLTGGLGFNQHVALRTWVNDQGIPCESLDKEHMAALLGSDVDETPDEFEEPGVELPDHVRRMVEIKQLVGSTSISKLETMRKIVNLDGRARGLLQYHGTGPGRQTSKLLQLHNFPKGLIKGSDGEAPKWEALLPILMTGDAGLVEACFGAPVHVVLSCLRHCLIAEFDREYHAGDYSGIQARLVLAMAGQHDKTALMASGADVYIDMAQRIFKRPIDKKRDPWERGIGKNSVLGLGFRMGAKTFQFKYAKEHSLDFCQGVVDTYRKEWAPEVPKLWDAMQDAALYAVHDRRVTEAYGCQFALHDGWLTLRLPSGRYLWYFNPTPCRRHMPWSTPEKPDIRDAWTYQTTKMGRWVTVDVHGGKTTENVVMGMERDLMTNSQFALEREGYPLVMEVHDENLAEPPKGADLNMFKQIMEDVPAWAREIKVPVQVDVWADTRYKK